MSKQKGIAIKGTLTIGQGINNDLHSARVIAPYGNREKCDIDFSADGRSILLCMDRESAIKLANRILDELICG